METNQLAELYEKERGGMYATTDFFRNPKNIGIRKFNHEGALKGWGYQSHYHLAGRVYAILKFWEGSGEGFDDLKTAFDTYKSSAVPITSGKNKGWLGWPSDRECGKDNPGDIERCAGGTSLWEFFMARVWMRFFLVIHHSPILKAEIEVKHPGWFDESVAFLGTNIFEKWLQNGIENFYRSRTHMAMEAAEFCLYYHNVTDNAKALEIAENVYLKGMDKWKTSDVPPSNNFIGQLKEVDNRYVWNMTWNGIAPAVQDIDHWGHFVPSIIAGYEFGIPGYSPDVMGKFANTLDHVTKSYPKFLTTPNVDGAGTGSSQGDLTYLFLFSLGQFNSLIQDKIAENIDANDANMIPFAGVAYYNQVIIESGRPKYPEHYMPVDGPFKVAIPPVEEIPSGEGELIITVPPGIKKITINL